MEEHSIRLVQRDFWQGLADKLSQRSKTPLYVDSRHISEPDSYIPQKRNLPSDSVHYVLLTNTVQDYIGVKLQIEDENHEIFTHLKDRKSEIESEISPALEWSTGKAWDKVVLKRNGNLKTDREHWDDYHNWLIEYGEKFDNVFGQQLRNIDT